MLTTITGRRAASVLLAALVGVVLVTSGGPSRGSADGVNADAGHAHVVAKHVRATQAVTPEHVDHARVHVDLAATPPAADEDAQVTIDHAAAAPPDVRPSRDVIAATGRGPPTA